MKKLYTLMSFMAFGFLSNAQCTELFFSEYAEGSSNNKYMEIYNPTQSAVDLSAYKVFTIVNGGSNTSELQLSGSLAPNSVYIFAANQANASILAVADTALAFPSVVHFNGDDCILLLKGTDTIDQVGERWNDPGTEWIVGTGSTKDHTLVRKSTVQNPDTAWASTSVQGWDVLPNNDWSNIGTHVSDCHSAAAAQCTELFFSEYAEGSSNNKYMEIYNPTQSAVDLSAYKVFTIVNGGSNTSELQLSGSLAPNSVYIFAANQANASILAVADTALAFPSVVHFNGDDCILLLKGTDTIDQVGERWNDPGTEWIVGTGSTKDHTLVRKSTVQNPDTAWASTSVQGWDVLPNNDWSNIGTHVSDCHPAAAIATAPEVAAADPTPAAKDVISLFSDVYDDVAVSTWRTDWTPGATVLTDTTADGNNVKRYTNLDFVGIEFTGANSLDVSAMEYIYFDVWSPDIETIQVKLVDWGADNAFGGGDDSEFEIATTNVANGQWVNVQLKLSDFTGLTSRANMSQLILSARPVGSNPTIFVDNVIFWKEPTIVYNKVNIADAIQLDSDLAPTNEDTLYEFTGIVYGIDYRGGNGLSFTLIDETAGINIFNFSDVNDYVVTEGDELTVRGKMDFFRGLLQLFVDSIAVNSQGNPLKAPTLVAAPSEETESDFIQLEKVWITNDTTTVWPNHRNVELTNENNDTFQIRIDRNVLDVVGTPVLFDTMTITGLGGQFDNSAPYDEGYQIFPRRLSDIAEYVDKTSVKEIAIETMVYPNPTSNNLTVIGSTKWNTFKVYTLVGREISTGTLNNNNLSVTNLQNGTYIIKLYAGDKVGVARFMVNR